MDAIALTKWVYDFEEGSRDMRALLGGKGANVAEMTRVLGPELVPAGFTITTEACVHYLREGRAPDGLAAAIDDAVARLEGGAGRRLGDPADPLLVSVRRGAGDSVPGMLDTVLHLGLNDASVRGLAATTGDERFAWDCYRRLVQMFGNVVRGIPGERFETEIAGRCSRRGAARARSPTAASTASPRSGAPRSTCSGWSSATVDVAPAPAWRSRATRSPAPRTRAATFLVDAQGEDVVSGVRTPRDLSELDAWLPGIRDQLLDILGRLERHYGDMQDTESRSRTRGCTCSGRAAPSATRAPPSASPSTRWTRASSAPPRRSPPSTPTAWTR